MAYDVSLNDDSWPQDRYAFVSIKHIKYLGTSLESTSNTWEWLDVWVYAIAKHLVIDPLVFIMRINTIL